MKILLLLAAIFAKRFIIKVSDKLPSGIKVHGSANDIMLIEHESMEEVMKINNVLSAEEDTEFHTFESQANPEWNLERLSDTSGRYTYPDIISDTNVYIIDTGIDIHHPEFEGRATWGKNFTDDGQDIDCHGHGTHVAGTVGSKTYGVHKKANLIAAKVLGCDGGGSIFGIINSIFWVINEHKNNDCKKTIINMSLGGAGRSELFEDALKQAKNAGIIVVVAAGNENMDACEVFPAGYDSVLTVGATDKYNSFAPFSNYGKCVDILSPGVSINSTIPDGKTERFSGTSMASPHVAGVASLMLSYCNFTPEEVIDCIVDTAKLNIISGVKHDTVNKLLFSDDMPVVCPVLYCTIPVKNFEVGLTIIIPTSVAVVILLCVLGVLLYKKFYKK